MKVYYPSGVGFGGGGVILVSVLTFCQDHRQSFCRYIRIVTITEDDNEISGFKDVTLILLTCPSKVDSRDNVDQ